MRAAACTSPGGAMKVQRFGGRVCRWRAFGRRLRLLGACGCLLVLASTLRAQDMPVPPSPTQPGHPAFTQNAPNAIADPQRAAAATSEQSPDLPVPAPPAVPPVPAPPVAQPVSAPPTDPATVSQRAAPIETLQPAKFANAAELDARVHELEAIVQQMQSHSGQGFAVPVSAMQPGPPGPDPENYLPPEPRRKSACRSNRFSHEHRFCEYVRITLQRLRHQDAGPEFCVEIHGPNPIGLP